MIKFLIAIMLLVIGIKLIYSYNASLCTKYDFAELTLKGEKSEQEKEEQGNSKHDNGDENFQYSMVCPLLLTAAKLLRHPLQQDVYLSFVNSPSTPPPDMV